MSAPLSVEERPRSIEQLADRYGQAWNDHDLDAIMALHTEQTAFELHQAGTPEATTREEVRESFQQLLEAWPDQHFEVQRLYTRQALYVCESVITGTLARPWTLGNQTVEPNGKTIQFGIVDIMLCEQNLVKRKDSWLDLVALQQGLGLLD